MRDYSDILKSLKSCDYGDSTHRPNVIHPLDNRESLQDQPEAGFHNGCQPSPEKPLSCNPPEDIELALKVGGYLEMLPAHRSATASEIAEALHGRSYTLAQMTDIYGICEELREAKILIRGRDGYGYQFA